MPTDTTMSGSAEPLSLPTRRRLMKEWASIRSELDGRPRTSSQGVVAGAPTAGRPAAAAAAAAAGAGGGCHPDLLELRPYDVDGEDLLEWLAVIRGSKGGFYEGYLFTLSILVPPTYPTHPPKCSFRTRIWHPNVNWKDGSICLDVLTPQSWTPAWGLSSICTAILSLLEDPEPDSPLNVDAANVFRSGDLTAYRSACGMFCKVWGRREEESGEGEAGELDEEEEEELFDD